MNKSWNRFLNLVIDLKRELENKKIKYDYDPIGIQKNETCINHWLKLLNEDKWNYLFSGVQLNQYKDYITVHYKKLFQAFDANGNDVSYNDFFKIYDNLYRDCRGIVIDVRNEKIVLAPFKKFFNINENEETALKNIEERIKGAKSIEISNKLDGSMVSIGFYNNEIVVSSSTMCNPEVSPIVKNSIKYINEHKNYEKMIKENKGLTFVFEHIFPFIDPHIVVYKNFGLYLIGIRDANTGVEYSYKEIKKYANEYKVLMTEIFNKSFYDIINNLSDKKAEEAEGFVINIDGYRLKVKYDNYLLIHKTLNNMASFNTVIKAIEDENVDDLISKMPKAYKEQIIKIIDTVNDYCNKLENKISSYYNNIKNDDKRNAMIWINNNVPKKYQVYVRNKYLGIKYSYLKTFSGHYKTLNELEELVKEF